MWPWATPPATWTQTRRACLGRHHHQRRKDGKETPFSTKCDDTCVFSCFFFFCLLRLPGLLVVVAGSTPQQLAAVVCSYLLSACYKWGGRILNTMLKSNERRWKYV
ncbi:unnamed protein product [Pylaiella littoralis]